LRPYKVGHLTQISRCLGPLAISSDALCFTIGIGQCKSIHNSMFVEMLNNSAAEHRVPHVAGETTRTITIYIIINLVMYFFYYVFLYRNEYNKSARSFWFIYNKNVRNIMSKPVYIHVKTYHFLNYWIYCANLL